MSENRKTYSVSQYNSAVEKLLSERVPAIWVRGTLMNLQERGRSVYLQLAEFVEGSHKPVAALDLFLFRGQYEAIVDRLSQEPKPFQMEPGIQLCFLIDAKFYVPSGRFQPQIRDIDPTYTLGELARTRAAILKRLIEEGLVHLNKEKQLSATPLSIGVITAVGSAAEQDFKKIIGDTSFSFQIETLDARMQGPETERMVVAALAEMIQRPLDCIVLIRGGGSKSDLVWFDSEAICRAIATSPIPVLTGIGHEIDRSLVDEVAWRDCITPTDCARFLVERLTQTQESVFQLARMLEKGWLRRLEVERKSLLLLMQRVRRSGEIKRQQQRQWIDELARGISPRFFRRSERERARLATDAHGLERGSRKILDRESALVEARDQQIRLVDPKRVLERGFALVRRSATGRSARWGEFIFGEEVEIELIEGVIGARVETLSHSASTSNQPPPSLVQSKKTEGE